MDPVSVWNMRGICKIVSVFSNVYSKISLKLRSLPTSIEIFPCYLHVHKEAGTIHCYTPSPCRGKGQEWGGGFVNPADVQNFICTSETPVQIGM